MEDQRLETLSDCVREELDLRVECVSCGYTVTMISDTWRDQLIARGKSVRIREIERKLRCSKCGARNSHIVPVMRF